MACGHRHTSRQRLTEVRVRVAVIVARLTATDWQILHSTDEENSDFAALVLERERLKRTKTNVITIREMSSSRALRKTRTEGLLNQERRIPGFGADGHLLPPPPPKKKKKREKKEKRKQ